MSDPANAGRVLLDPNTLSSNGAPWLCQWLSAPTAVYLRMHFPEAGSDWQVWHVRDVSTGKDLPDTLQWSEASGGSWRKDGSGFYYTAYDPPKSGTGLKAANEYEKLYFHRLGSPQSDDVPDFTPPQRQSKLVRRGRGDGRCRRYSSFNRRWAPTNATRF